MADRCSSLVGGACCLASNWLRRCLGAPVRRPPMRRLPLSSSCAAWPFGSQLGARWRPISPPPKFIDVSAVPFWSASAGPGPVLRNKGSTLVRSVVGTPATVAESATTPPMCCRCARREAVRPKRWVAFIGSGYLFKLLRRPARHPALLPAGGLVRQLAGGARGGGGTGLSSSNEQGQMSRRCVAGGSAPP